MLYYHRNLLVLSLTSFLVACGSNQVVPFLPLFIKELGVTGGVAFWAGVTLAAPTLPMILMLPYWGKLADKYGAKLMIIRAGVCGVLIFFGMSYCRTLWQLLLLRVLSGLLTGFIPGSITLVGTNTPQPEAVRSVAVVQSAMAFGTIVGPSVGSILANWVNYRDSMQIAGLMAAVAVLLIYLLVEERQKGTAGNQTTSLWQDLRLAIKKPVLVTVLYSNIAYGFVSIVCQPILVLYIQELVGKRANLFVGPIFALPGLALVLSNYYWCRLGERYTFQRIILLGLIGVGIFSMSQGLVRNIWWFAFTYFSVGFCATAVSPGTAGLIVTKLETDFQGRAFALQQSAQCFGSFLAPLLAGFLGSILPLQWVFTVVGLLGLTMVTVIRIQMHTYKYISKEKLDVNI
jgi:DHA1 family multidrug resistance protein-like MFS transporter